MVLEYLLIISFVQGIFEFLPISSSGHLALLPALTNNSDQGIFIDVAAHFGTLWAVLIYFIKDVKNLSVGFVSGVLGKPDNYFRLCFVIVVATIPVVLAGFLIEPYVDEFLRNPLVIGYAFVIFGVVLGISDRVSIRYNSWHKMPYSHALFIGLMQTFALIPGASRSGMAMSGARFLGYDRVSSSIFSSLISIPTILGAMVLLFIKNFSEINFLNYDWLLVMIISFIAAIISIGILMKVSEKLSYFPFVIYRVIVGAIIVIMHTF